MENPRVTKDGMKFSYDAKSDREQMLFEWWMTTAFEDFLKQAPKMEEYGGDVVAQLVADKEPENSADLTVMGDALAVLLHWTPRSPVALELSVWFYLLGKIARLISDYQAQRPGKQDTWHDITVYSMMGRRIQEVGRWP